MIEALQQSLDAVAEDTTVNVVILAGNGPVFCAGHDLKEMSAAGFKRIYSPGALSRRLLWQRYRPWCYSVYVFQSRSRNKHQVGEQYPSSYASPSSSQP